MPPTMHPREWNAPNYLITWAFNATEDVPEPTREEMRTHAQRLIDKGAWRGNISEYLVNRWPEHRKLLKDLYL